MINAQGLKKKGSGEYNGREKEKRFAY